MKTFEVFYTYCVDASMVIEATSEEDAEARAEKLWKLGQQDEKLSDFADFEVLSVKKR